MSDDPSHDHEIDTGKGTFALSELGSLMPGMAEIMPLVGARIWKCYYAGKAGNRALARFQLKEAVNLMEKGAFLRPKYAENMDKFITDEVGALGKCIEAEDWEGFESAFAAMVDAANAYHELYDKSFLRWKIPDSPPPDLDLTPRPIGRLPAPSLPRDGVLARRYRKPVHDPLRGLGPARRHRGGPQRARRPERRSRRNALPPAPGVEYRTHCPAGAQHACPADTVIDSPSVWTNTSPSITTVYSSKSGRWPGSDHPAGLSMTATETSAVPVVSLPTNSEIVLGGVPAA